MERTEISGERPIGAARCRQQHNPASCQPPPPPPFAQPQTARFADFTASLCSVADRCRSPRALPLPLRTYLKKAEAAERRGQALVSNIVGSGRDVVARHRDGHNVRVFLMVDRVDRSGRAHDCLFLGSMVHVAESAPSERTSTARTSVSSRTSSQASRSTRGPTKRFGSHSRSSSFRSSGVGDRRSIVTQDSIAISVGGGDTGSVYSRSARTAVRMLSKGRLCRFAQPLASKRCTVLVVETWGMQRDDKGDATVLTRCYETLLQHLTGGCARNNGHLHCLVGDRAVVTFNATVPNTSHRPAAAHMMVQLHKDLKSTLSTRYLACPALCLGRMGPGGQPAVPPGDKFRWGQN